MARFFLLTFCERTINSIRQHVVEIKATLWDRVKRKNVRRICASHQRQVWRYVEKHLEGDRVEVCAGIIYPRAPRRPGLKEQTEQFLNDCGIQVVWYDD